MSKPATFPVQIPQGEHTVVLPAEAILRLKADYEADVKLLEELPVRIRLKKRRYEAALLFAPPGFDPNAAEASGGPPPSPDPAPIVEPAAEERDFELEVDDGQGRITWIGELARVVEQAEQGLTHQEALALLKAIPQLGERSSAGDKGFYNAVARLEKNHRLIKHGGRLYSPRVVAAMAERGVMLGEISPEMRRRAGGSGAVALEVLREHPEGLDAMRLREELSKKEGVPASITKHSHYIYNVLSTLMGQGAISKDAKGVYKIADQERNAA